MSLSKQGFATRAIRAGQDPSQWNYGSVVTPLVMSTTFQQDAPAQHRGYKYGRSGNPTRTVLETCIAALDNGNHGFVFASGLGAITVMTSLLESGDHILSGDDIYGGTNRLFQQCLSKQQIKVSFADVIDTDKFMASIQPNTKMVWLETPTNPLLRIADIRAISDILKKKYPEIILVVDNTFLTSYFQKPLDLGADIVVYSLTKYMNGHSDVIMGAAVTNKKDLAQRIGFLQNAMGIVPSPFDCSLVLRSLKTLELRMKQHMHSGLIIAKFLEGHPLVEKVFHPYLPSHSQYELTLRQTSGHSGMISFYLNGNPYKFLKSLKIFILAESLGGYDSLAGMPSLMAQSSVPEAEKAKLGITDKLIRLSVGLENTEDLVEDLKQAFEACAN